MSNDKQYNYIYKKLVNSDSDIQGIVSYHFYKKQKVEWCKEFKKNNKRDATNDELKTFHNSFTDEAISSLKIKSEKTLTEFAKIIVGKEINVIDTTIDKTLKKSTSFWSNVGINILSSIIYSILIALITFIVWSLDHDFISELIKYLSK